MAGNVLGKLTMAEIQAFQHQALESFVKESNYIEGIYNVTQVEIAAHMSFLDLDVVRVRDLTELCALLAGARLRGDRGMDVMVGDHVPPPGGPAILSALRELLEKAQDHEYGKPRPTPWAIHREYETLHPFMDGNGRTGRALWLWMHLRDDPTYWVRMRSGEHYRGFLQLFYYETLSQTRLSTELQSGFDSRGSGWQ